MTNRRNFILQCAMAAPAFFTPRASAQSAPLPSPDLEEEEYWKGVRKQFSLNRDIIFLNNGTMGPSPDSVIEAQVNTLKEINENAHYGGWFEVVPELAEFFEAEKAEICPTHNVTDGINIIAQGLQLKRGDEIILSNQEHVGNAMPWLTRAKRDGLKIKVLDLNLPDDQLLDQMNKLCTSKTRVLAVPHIPCTNGRVVPVQKLSELARKKGLFIFYDGAHGAGMLDLKLHEIDCDFYATCTHKWLLGPKGTGFVFIRKDKLDAVTPVFSGAYSDTGWNLIDGNPRIEGWSHHAKRHLNGTQNAASYAGVIAAIDFHRQIGKARIAARIRTLNQLLWDRLEAMPGVELITPKDQRAGMLAFRPKGRTYTDFQRYCEPKHIVVRAVPENEVNAIRVSTHIYNSPEEIAIFAETLEAFLHA